MNGEGDHHCGQKCSRREEQPERVNVFAGFTRVVRSHLVSLTVRRTETISKNNAGYILKVHHEYYTTCPSTVFWQWRLVGAAAPGPVHSVSGVGGGSADVVTAPGAALLRWHAIWRRLYAGLR